MARSDFLKNELASEYAQRAQYASLHSAPPGVTGANEVPLVDRQPIAWVVTGAGKIQSQPITFLVPAGSVVTDIGMWSDATGGTYVDSVVHNAEFPVERTYKVVLSYAQP